MTTYLNRAYKLVITPSSKFRKRLVLAIKAPEFLIISALTIVALLIPGSASAFSGSGTGTNLDPYEVSNCVQLQEIKDDLSSSYILTTDIDCSDTINWNSGKGFEPIGDDGTPFTGTLDGANHEVQDLSIIRADDSQYDYEEDESNVGLIGRAENATISNIHVVNSKIKGWINVGGIIGFMQGGTLSNSSVNLDVADNGCDPGKCVWARYGYYGGGLVGYMSGGSISNSQSAGPVKGSGSVIGGLVGSMNDHASINSSSSSSNIDGGQKLGGAVGELVSGSLYKVSASGSVYANVAENYKDGMYAGGLIGHMTEGVVRQSYSTGSAHGETNYAGGFAGVIYGGNIQDSYSTADATADNAYAGGFAGAIYGGNIKRTYSSGDATSGGIMAGGFAGEISYSSSPIVVENSFTASLVSVPSEMAGGFMASPYSGDVTLNNVYYDAIATDQPHCAGDTDYEGCHLVNESDGDPNYFIENDLNSPLDTWDFYNTWQTNEDGYPTLNLNNIDVSPLCEEPQVTATTGRTYCELQYSVEPDPEFLGQTTWEARYKKASDSGWTDVEITDNNTGEMIFMGLDPATEYQLALRPTNNIFSEWAVVDITTLAADSDLDSDGSPDINENDGPNNGDANDDGTLDSLQANVLSYINPLTEQPALLEAVNCTSITAFQIGSEASSPADPDFNYPMGLAAFHITCDNPGDTATIRQYFYGVEGNENYSVRKWMNDGSYREVPGYELMGIPIDDQIVFLVEYEITDGSEFDDDGLVDGVIVDPSGPALAVSTTSSDISSVQTSTGLAGTGDSALILSVLASILLISSISALIKVRA